MNSDTTFWKICAIYCKKYCYGLIYLTYFVLIIHYFFLHFCIYLHHKKLETTQYRYHLEYQVQALNIRTIWGSGRLLGARLIFYCNLTGTQVSKLILYSNQYVLAWKIVLVLLHWQKSDKGHIFKKRLFFVILIKLLANGMGGELGRGHHYTTESVIYIAISIISVWSISSIIIPMTYYFFFHVLFLALLIRNKTN